MGRVVALAAVLLAFGAGGFAAAPAQADSGGSFGVPFMPTAPVVDGIQSFGEWDVVAPIPLQMTNGIQGTAWVGRDASYLYVAMRVPGSGGLGWVWFDNADNGTVDAGDDLMTSQADPDWYWVDPTSTSRDDNTAIANPGTNDVTQANALDGNGNQFFEFRKPLCSADTAHDFCFTKGKLGIDFEYDLAGVGHIAPSSSFTEQSGFAELLFGPPPPTVTLASNEGSQSLQLQRNGAYLVWFNPASSGSFTLSVPQNDDAAGIVSASWPSVPATAGWHPEVQGLSRRDGVYTFDQGAGDPSSFGVTSTDADGQTSGVRTVGFVHDSTPPSAGVTCQPVGCLNTSGPVRVTLTGSDNQSGLKTFQYTLDSSVASPTWVDVSPGTLISVTTAAPHFAVQAVDNVGNVGASTASISGTSPPASLTWNYANDFQEQSNPGPDLYGNAGVWAYGEIPIASEHNQATSTLYTLESRPGNGQSCWLSSNLDAGAVPDACIIVGTSPPGTDIDPAQARDTFVRWTSPIDGTVSVSGGFADEDAAAGDGFNWFVDKNGTTLASATVPNGGASAFDRSVQNITVAKGDQLVFAVGPGPNPTDPIDYHNDSTDADITITQVGDGGGGTTQIPTSTSSSPSATSIRVGDTVTDTASVSNAGGTAGFPTGTVDFFVCGPLATAAGCATGGTGVGTRDYNATASVAVDSDPFTADTAGYYCFRAEFDGGGGQWANSSDGSTGECFQVLPAGTFVVNTTADHNDETCDATDCTLREAIFAANGYAGTAHIDFAIGTPNPTITVGSPLPALTSNTVVDGGTELGTPGVTIDSALEGSGDGLLVSGSNATILGLHVTGFPDAGIHVTGNGVHVQGSQADHNGQDGILVEHETGALVEDSTAADNKGHGIELFDVLKAAAAHNTVERNGIDGLAIDGGAENTLENNTASDNQNQGLSIFTVRAATETNGNLVVENTSTGNGGDGIRVFDGVNNTIGTPSRPNVVHGNATSSGHGGVAIYSSRFGSSGNTIRGNSIYDNDHDDFSPLGIFVQGGTQIPVPTLKPFVRGGTVFVNGRLAGTPSTTYTIDVYTSGACSPTGFGEGETWKNSVDVTTDVSGAATIPFNFDALATSTNVTLTATDDTLHQTGEFSRCATLATGGTATSATLSLDTDTQSTLPGVASVPLSDIPASAFGSSTASDGSTQAAPLSAIPLSAIPLSAIPLSAIPLSAIPLSAIGLTPQTLAENGLGGVPLNTIPLKAPLSWEQELQGTPLANLPIQTLTLKDVLALPTPPANLTTPGPNAIGLKDIDLSHSPLSAIPLSAIALGSAPLSAIPISGDGSKTAAQNAADWCAAIQALPEFASYDCTGIGSQTVMGIALQGVPLSAIPLSAIPLSAIPLSAIPLSAIPLSAIDVSSSPLSAIPLSAIDIGATPLSAIPLSAISTTVDCTSFVCTGKTLADAVAAGVLKPGATLGDLLSYFQAHAEITLAQLVPGLPDSVTFGDLLAALLGGNAPSWEQLPLDGLQAFAGAQNASGGLVTYTAHFTITGTGDTAVAALDVAIPDDAYYVPGSATLNGAALADPVAGAGHLTWPLASLTYGTAYTLAFQARPGFRLGDEAAKATLTTNGIGPQSAPATVAVHDTFESNDSPTTSVPAVQPNTLYVSYIGNGKDLDYSTLHVDGTNAPAGSRIRIFLSHLHSDDDLAVFGAGQQPLRSAPLSAIPLSAIPTTDQPVQLGQESQALAPDTAQDIPLPAGKQLLGVSDNRGTADEEVDLTSTGISDDLLIQVSSYDGHPTADPYVLRVEIDLPPSLPPCTQTAPAGTGTTEATMPTITSSTQTLILFDEKRLAQYYSQADAHTVYTKLQAYAARSDVNGAIVPVEANSAVASAYAAWDASLCSPDAANGVVRAIGKVLDTLQAGHPNLKTIVVVGEDNIIPFARLLDQTQQANELGFASSFGFVGNEYTSAVQRGYLLSDDPYADPDPQPLFGGSLYVPKLALGRLVETPQQIEQQLDAYQAANGLANPQTKLVTGYDFLSDGSQAVDSALGRTAPNGSLIGETWTADQLRGALLGGSTQPLIDSLNAHYDQHRALSAQGNATHDESAPNLFTTTDLQGKNLAGRIVFTMGCHAGFSLFDGLQYFGTDPNPTDFTFDWAQAYLAGGAIEFMGNTGYGLGDTTAVAYSERLNQLFAQRLDGTMTIGEALEYAKQEYVGDLGVLSLYDAKVGNEATLYGIPTYRLGTGTPPAPPAAPGTYTDPATGLTASDFAVNPAYTSHPNATLGDYFSANDPNGLGIQVTNRRPIEPLTSLDVTEPATIAHGILLTGLASNDTPGFHAAFGRVADDSSAIEPQLTGVTDFPAQIQSLATIATPNGQRQRAVLITGHFASGSAGNVGVQRLFTRLAGTVLYSTSTDFTKPTIRNVQVLQQGSGVGFAADVADPNGIKEVVVVYLDGSGTWQRANLTCANGRCTGGGPLTGTTVDYIVQAVDANGNVGINANKAAAANVAPSGTGHISISIAGASQTGSWYSGPVTATLSSDDGAALSSSLDGAPYVSYVTGTPVPVSGDGLHVLDVRGSDGSSATFAIGIDTQGPTISIWPPDGSFLLAGDPVVYSCFDAGSGIASCAGTVPSGTVPTSGGTLTVNAKDFVGKTATKSSTYQVWPFTGFFEPVNNLPTVNLVKAGSAVPVKFSLGGNRGLTFATFGSQNVVCDNGAPLDDIEQTVTAGGNSLQYDSATNQYTYVWKTDKSFAGQCRLFTITFTNGDTRTAKFKFK